MTAVRLVQSTAASYAPIKMARWPSTGEWHKGDVVWNSTPGLGLAPFWINIGGGSPGVWMNGDDGTIAGLGTTYYVANAGSDSANGTSTGTPWQTVAHVLTQSFQPGDRILFNRGDAWDEQLTWATAMGKGTPGKPIIIGAYGSGAQPLIRGTHQLDQANWTLSSGMTATYQKGLTTDPKTIFLEDGVPMTQKTSIAAVDAAPGSYYWASNIVYVHSAAGNVNPTTGAHLYRHPVRNNAISIPGGSSSAVGTQDFIEVWDITAEGCLQAGMHIKHVQGCGYRRCTGRYNVQHGLNHGNEGAQLNLDGFNEDCVAYGNKQSGIIGGSLKSTIGNGHLVWNPLSHDNGNDYWLYHGVYLSYGDNTRCYGGTAYGNSAHNYKFGGGVTGGFVLRCVSYSAGHAGFFVDPPTTTAAVRFVNVTDDGSQIGLYMYDLSGDFTLSEVSNSVFVNETTACVKKTSGSTITTFRNNDVYNGTALYSGMTSQTGSNGNLNVNPAFTNQAGHDYSLTAGSPLINAGVIITDLNPSLAYVGAAPDIGAVEYGAIP